MPQVRLPIASLVILACSSANADWVLSTYPTAAADSAQANAIYGIQSVANKSSSVTTKVVAGTPGYVSLVADKIASDGTEGYSANVGLLHPLTPDWKEYDLTGLTGVSFEYQNTSKITEVLSVSFGSGSYPEAIAKAGTVYEAVLSSATQLAAGTTWKKGEVAILDFETPTWWTAPANFPTRDSVLKRVKHLQFALKTLYTDSGSQNGKACAKCVTPTMSSQTLNIRNVVLLGGGIVPPFRPKDDGRGCVDATLSLPFSNFAEESPKSVVGGPFFAFSDFDSTGVSTEESKGSTIVSDTIVAGANEEASQLEVRAKLNKKIGDTYHKYSGWVGLGTNFGRAGNYGIGTGITGFGFAIGSLGINVERVSTIDFKVKMIGVSDTAVHFVSLPVADINEAGGAGKMACIRPSDLKQASYVAPAHQIAFNPAKIEQISWEAKITDNKQSSIDTATANFFVSEITLYGIDFMGIGPIQGVNSRNHNKTFAAYSNGVLSLSGFSGVSAFDVTTLDGKVVASFASAPRVSLALPRGTYLLTAKNGSLSQKFAVVGR